MKGTYTVGVTISDGTETAGSQQLVITVLDPSTNTFKISYAKIGLDFTASGADPAKSKSAIAFICTLPVLNPFNPTGKNLRVRIGDAADADRIEKTFRFVDSKKATVAGDINSLATIKLNAKGATAGALSQAQLTVDMRKVTTLTAALDSMGFDNATSQEGEECDGDAGDGGAGRAGPSELTGSMVVQYKAAVNKKGSATGKVK